jgi:hypothetical protein
MVRIVLLTSLMLLSCGQQYGLGDSTSVITSDMLYGEWEAYDTVTHKFGELRDTSISWTWYSFTPVEYARRDSIVKRARGELEIPNFCSHQEGVYSLKDGRVYFCIDTVKSTKCTDYIQPPYYDSKVSRVSDECILIDRLRFIRMSDSNRGK